MCVTGNVMIDRRALGEPGNVVIEDTRDMVGMARALVLAPDLPNKLLSGQDPVCQFKPITAGIKAIDRSEILKIYWCTGQVKRIGNGQAPIPQESGLWVMAKLAWQMAFPGKKRLPTKLRAG